MAISGNLRFNTKFILKFILWGAYPRRRYFLTNILGVLFLILNMFSLVSTIFTVSRIRLLYPNFYDF